jgi:CBS domain containing-hemolysin-like protein
MTLALALAIVALLAAALLRAAASSLQEASRADTVREAASGSPGAEAVARLLARPGRLQPAANIAHVCLLVIAAVSATWAVAESGAEPQLLWLVVLALGLIVLGDWIPRAIGRSRPRRVAYVLAPILSLGVRFGSKADDLLPAEGEGNGDESGAAPEDEQERELISSVLDFTDTIVREVMVPRTDMITVPGDAPIDDFLKLVDEHGFSRYPVTDPSGDVVGMVIAKDLLSALGGGRRPERPSEIMRAIEFVPETKRASELLEELQGSKTHLVIVVDEFGDVAGLVTIEDLLEELVGEITDEYDEEEDMIVRLGDRKWKVDARVPVAELSEEVGVALPDDEWDTVGGLVLGLAGRVPEEGETFRSGELVLAVTKLQGLRVADVEVTRQPANDQDEVQAGK